MHTLAYLLVVTERGCVLLLHDQSGRVDELLGTDSGILLVQRLGLNIDSLGVTTLKLYSDPAGVSYQWVNNTDDLHVVLGNGPVSRCNWVNDLLVGSPNTIPLEL